MADPEVHVGKDRARGGETPHVVRYVLAVSIVLVIIGMIIVLVAK